MTILIDRRSKTHRGNGVTTVFPFDFPIPDVESLRVSVFDETTNVETALASSQYTVTWPGGDFFGSVTYPTAGTPLSATQTITILREVPYTQEMDIQNQGGFYPEVLEDQLDAIVMQVQQVAEEGRGALRAAVGETFTRLAPKSALASKVLGFDAAGEPNALTAIPLGSATFATETEARAGTSISTIMSPLRTFQAISERTRALLPEDFIGGASDPTAGLQAFFSALATGGGKGLLTKWYDITGPISVSGVAVPFQVEGVGKYVSGLRRASATPFTVLQVVADDFVLRGFGVDGGRTTFPSSGMNAIRLRGSRWEALSLYARDYSGTGILGAANTGETENLNRVQDCHVDGTGGAQFGISMNSQIDGMVSGCLVENVHSAASTIGINLAGCSSTSVANCKVRNSYTSIQIASGTEGVGSNNQVSDVVVTSPNGSSSSGSTPVGVRLNAGSSLAVRGASIDGGNEDNFIGVQIDNNPDGGAAVEFRASHCAGAGSYALKILGTSYSLVIVSSVFNVNTKFVHLSGASANNTVLLGRKEGTPIYAPWTHVQNDSADLTNLVQLLSGDITQTAVLDDDQAVSFQVVDGVIGLLEVVGGGADEYFSGRVNFSSSPTIDGFFDSAKVAVGTVALTTGTGNGVDAKLNINATLDKLYIKNRVGAARTVLFRLVMA